MTNEILLPEWDTIPDVFSTYSITIDKILKGINDLQITDASSCKLALNTSSDVKMILKDILSIKKKTTDPYKNFVNLINESAKVFTDKLELIQKIISDKVTAYDDHIKTAHRDAQKSNEMNCQSFDIGSDLIALNQEKIGSTAKTIVSHKIEQSFSVVKESLIPREYLKIDEDKIKRAIKMGIMNIPGISVIETKKLILRRR